MFVNQKQISDIRISCLQIQCIQKLNIQQQIELQQTGMSFRTIQHEVDQLFDRADHPNIAHKDDMDSRPLHKVRKLPITQIQSIQIMKDVLQAIVYVSTHLIVYKPCQIFKQHIIQKYSRWGLCNIICYRDPSQSIQFDPNRYYPVDYQAHPNQDSELIWSLGRVWFQLLTNMKIAPIKYLNQKQLDKLIQTYIKDSRIKKILKQILVIDQNKRMSIATLFTNGLFQYEQKSKIFLNSVVPNLSQVQQFSKIIAADKFQSKISRQQQYNPFQQQLYKRDFKQALIIADLFQKVKQFIFNSFQAQQNNHEIHFSCYLIDLFSYLRLNGFKIKRQQNQYLIVLLYDKHDYTKYMQRLIQLQDKIQRKRKMKKFQKYRQKFPTLLQSPSQYKNQDEKLIYQHFKTYLMSYARYYKQKRMQTKAMDCKSYVKLIEMMLVRSANYVFTNCRKHVFGDFISADERFELKSVLQSIEKCQDIGLLQRLQKKILQLYFPSNTSTLNTNN